MTKKFLYAFALLGVAVVLGAAGCQQQGSDSLNEEQNSAAMQVKESAESNPVNNEESGQALQGEGTITGNAGDNTADDSGAMINDSEIKVFTIEGQNFTYSPNMMTVNKGDKVKIIFKNTGGTHDWNLDEFNAKTPIIQTGQSVEVTFTADKAGVFEYYCSIGSHRAMGMVGTLTVQ